jgi:hypothetical protein
VIRDIDEANLLNTDIHCIHGGYIKDATDFLDDIPENRYKQIVTLIGGNNCEDRRCDEQDIINEYKELIVKANSKAQQTTVASILPRICLDDEVMKKIDKVNNELATYCNSLDDTLKFVNNDTSFKLQDGDVNDGYFLMDGNTTKQVHLNFKGTKKLCHNLDLKVKAGKTATKDRSSKKVQDKKFSWKVDHTAPRDEHRGMESTYSSNPNSGKSCWFCGETNHIFNNCWHTKPILCRTCGQEGHKDKHHQNY